MFPAVLLVLQLFYTMKSLGILNTPWAVVLAHATFAVPFSALLLTSFFASIPRELD